MTPIDLSTLVAAIQTLTQTVGSSGKSLAAITNGVAILAVPPGYAVASLPAAAGNGAIAWASNGRKPGEGAGAGTGVPVFYNPATNNWFSYLSGTVVTA